MPKNPTRPEQFLERLVDATAAGGYVWRRSTYKLFRGPKEPLCFVHANFGVYPGSLRVKLEAWVGFQEAEIVVWRAAGRTLSEGRKGAKDRGTVGRHIGAWSSESPDFADVLDGVRDALLGPAIRHHQECGTMEGAVQAFERALAGDRKAVVLDTGHTPTRHLVLLYLLRDRERFDAAEQAWCEYGSNYVLVAREVASYLREHWDLHLTQE